MVFNSIRRDSMVLNGIRRDSMIFNGIRRDSMALLPRGSPFGDPGPHGDLFQILGPHFFFKVPIFSILGLRTREKSVQPPSNF